MNKPTLVLVLFSFALSACASTQEPPTVTALPTVTLIPTPSIVPTPYPTATAIPSKICSPLTVEPIDQLSQIITQPFIMPNKLAGGKYSDEQHHGVDLGFYSRDGKLFTGTEVTSIFSGKVAGVVRNRPPYGYAVVIESKKSEIPTSSAIILGLIDDQHSAYTLYAHLQDDLNINIGDSVDCGDVIAHTGLTGFTGGPHLHLEVRTGVSGEIFESMGYYRADMSPIEMDNYRRWRMSGDFVIFDPMSLFSQ